MKKYSKQIILRWSMYVIGLITIASAIACYAIDCNDFSDVLQHDLMASGTQHFLNIMLAIYMISTTIPLMIHYTQPRLIYIGIFFNLSILFLIIRWSFGLRFHPEFMLGIFLNIPLSGFYFSFIYSKTPKPKKSLAKLIIHVMIQDEIEIFSTTTTSKKSSSISIEKSQSKRKSSLTATGSKQKSSLTATGSKQKQESDNAG